MCSVMFFVLGTCFLTVNALSDICLKSPADRGQGNDGQWMMSNDTDVTGYLVSIALRLGVQNLVILSDQVHSLDSLNKGLQGRMVQCHVIPCNQSAPAPDVDAALSNLSQDLGDVMVITLGSRCFQRSVWQWLGSLPERIGRMSTQVQETRWLLAVDDHVMETTNVTSLFVNHVAFLVHHGQDRQVSLRTVTWGRSGRHLAGISEGSAADLDLVTLYPNTGRGLNGVLLRVAINIWKPYITAKDKGGRAVYRGYSVDLLNILAQSMNFTYVMILPEDLEWGDYRDGKWTGIMGQFERKEVDMSVAPMSARSERVEVVDWSVPLKFRYTGISVRSSEDTSHLISALLNPFAGEVYVYLLVVFVAFTCFFFGLVAMETRLLLLRQDEHRTAPSLFIIVEFLYGSFLKEIVPGDVMNYDGLRRPLIACWCLFSLLVTSFYTSKLTSLLIAVSPPPPFTSLEEMVDSGLFRWGMIGGTALLNSFRGSDDPLMQKVYRGVMTFHQEDPDVLDLDAKVHRAKMATGEYAFIGEESLLELWASEDCSIRVIRGKVMGLETYNSFTARRSVLTERIDYVYLTLGSSGIMTALQQRWWPDGRSCQQSSSDTASAQPAVSLPTLQLVFYAAAAGLLLAALALGRERLAAWRGLETWCPPTLVKQLQRVNGEDATVQQ